MQGEAVEDFTQISRERLEHTFNVNIIGMIRLAQEVVEHMPPGGSIINVSSVLISGEGVRCINRQAIVCLF